VTVLCGNLTLLEATFYLLARKRNWKWHLQTRTANHRRWK